MPKLPARSPDQKLKDLPAETQRAAVIAAATLAAGAVSAMEAYQVGGHIQLFFDSALDAIVARLKEK